MSKLKRLSGDEVISILKKFGFEIYSQRGNHVKLKRVTKEGRVQSLTIPRHKELDKGTLKAIIRQTAKFVPYEELEKEFYTER